jgi:hypothetical protein
MFNILRHRPSLFRSKKRRQSSSIPVACEVLEVRQVMTANLNVSIANGVLQIDGDNSNNTIVVRPVGSTRISIDGVAGK